MVLVMREVIEFSGVGEKCIALVIRTESTKMPETSSLCVKYSHYYYYYQLLIILIVKTQLFQQDKK